MLKQVQHDIVDVMELIVGLAILVYSAILHEIAHGYVADRLGDPTARLAGRLTLDPRPHIDPFLSVLLPLLLIISHSPIIFGGAKPVPIDPFNLKEGKKDVALVALAGPLTNVILAIIAALLIHVLSYVSSASPFLSVVLLFLYLVAQYNLLLGIFNLLPIPPLDGSKVIALVLPDREAQIYLSLSKVGILILFFLLMFPIGGFSLQGLITTLFLFSKNLLGV